MARDHIHQSKGTEWGTIFLQFRIWLGVLCVVAYNSETPNRRSVECQLSKEHHCYAASAVKPSRFMAYCRLKSLARLANFKFQPLKFCPLAVPCGAFSVHCAWGKNLTERAPFHVSSKGLQSCPCMFTCLWHAVWPHSRDQLQYVSINMYIHIYIYTPMYTYIHT